MLHTNILKKIKGINFCIVITNKQEFHLIPPQKEGNQKKKGPAPILYLRTNKTDSLKKFPFKIININNNEEPTPWINKYFKHTSTFLILLP